MGLFKPSSSMTFETVLHDQQKLKDFLYSIDVDNWVFDLTDVQYCDSAGVALLLEAIRLSRSKQVECEFRGLGQPLQTLIEFFGVKDIIQGAKC